MKRLLPVFFVLIFLTSCKQKQVPDGIIKEEEMVNLLTDIHIVDGYTNSIVADTLAKYGPVLYHSVLKKYHTDSAGMNRSIKYYSADPDHFKLMYERVKQNLDKIEKIEKKRADKQVKKVKTV